MSLKDVVLEIAEEMEATLNDWGNLKPPTVLSWAKQLKRAVQAAGDSTNNQAFTSPAAQHLAMIEAAKAEFRQKKLTQAEEGASTKTVLCLGGFADNAYHQVPGDMPEGAKTAINGSVYVLSQNQLIFHPEETRKMTKPKPSG